MATPSGLPPKYPSTPSPEIQNQQPSKNLSPVNKQEDENIASSANPGLKAVKENFSQNHASSPPHKSLSSSSDLNKNVEGKTRAAFADGIRSTVSRFPKFQNPFEKPPMPSPRSMTLSQNTEQHSRLNASTPPTKSVISPQQIQQKLRSENMKEAESLSRKLNVMGYPDPNRVITTENGDIILLKDFYHALKSLKDEGNLDQKIPVNNYQNDMSVRDILKIMQSSSHPITNDNDRVLTRLYSNAIPLFLNESPEKLTIKSQREEVSKNATDLRRKLESCSFKNVNVVDEPNRKISTKDFHNALVDLEKYGDLDHKFPVEKGPPLPIKEILSEMRTNGIQYLTNNDYQNKQIGDNLTLLIGRPEEKQSLNEQPIDPKRAMTKEAVTSLQKYSFPNGEKPIGTSDLIVSDFYNALTNLNRNGDLHLSFEAANGKFVSVATVLQTMKVQGMGHIQVLKEIGMPPPAPETHALRSLVINTINEHLSPYMKLKSVANASLEIIHNHQMNNPNARLNPNTSIGKVNDVELTVHAFNLALSELASTGDLNQEISIPTGERVVIKDIIIQMKYHGIDYLPEDLKSPISVAMDLILSDKPLPKSMIKPAKSTKTQVSTEGRPGIDAEIKPQASTHANLERTRSYRPPQTLLRSNTVSSPVPNTMKQQPKEAPPASKRSWVTRQPTVNRDEGAPPKPPEEKK